MNRLRSSPEVRNSVLCNLSFCKTILQIVLSAKRFAKPFYFKIRKAQIVTVERIFIIQAEKKQAVC